MQQFKKEDYLNVVVKQVKYIFAREEIRQELQTHINEKIEYLIDEGFDKDEAEDIALNDMGNPEEIGKLLNKEHSPLIGYLLSISNIILFFMVLMLSFRIFTVILIGIGNNLEKQVVDSEEVKKEIEVGEQIDIDGRVITIEKVYVLKNGDVYIESENYDKGIRSLPWNYSLFNEDITDEYGTRYNQSASALNMSNRKRRELVKIKDFRDDANTIVIKRDRYNRFFEVRIDLKGSDKNE